LIFGLKCRRVLGVTEVLKYRRTFFGTRNGKEEEQAGPTIKRFDSGHSATAAANDHDAATNNDTVTNATDDHDAAANNDTATNAPDDHDAASHKASKFPEEVTHWPFARRR
jgi:hypothetical protein